MGVSTTVRRELAAINATIEIISGTGGQLRVSKGGRTAHFWPASGRWIGKDAKGYGLVSITHYLTGGSYGSRTQ